MPLKTYNVAEVPIIEAKPLTPENFAEYGGVLSADHQIKNVRSSAANYGTATKIHKVAPIIDNFEKCPSKKKATANWNIFRCSAPSHLIESKAGEKRYTCKVLERHPFSTQTFVPMGQDLKKSSYLVIVGKSEENCKNKLPRVGDIKAFVCKGNQSITYGAGVWHAPMVVIDENISHLDFAVFIHENGVPEEDCQECYYDPGYKIAYKIHTDAKL